MKVSFLLARIQDSPGIYVMPYNNDKKSEDLKIIDALPVGIDKFTKLNERIAENALFKHRLSSMLLSIKGRDAKALVSILLRRLINDEVGEKFSLTGKASKAHAAKQSFEKTEVHKLIMDMIRHNFPHAKESVVRDAIGDWLMQSKFRKFRREQRMKAIKE